MALVPAVILAAAGTARAHFYLDAPASWKTQDAYGNPQKLGPCGDNGGTLSGIVTAVGEGDTITVTIHETVFHPGHYRIALAVNDRSELPPEPPVTAGTTACGSTIIQDPPVFPVLADGVFLHTTKFKEPQSIKIKLPDGVTCDHCTLQIIQFMSNHGLNNPGGCFYHHCADLAITASAAGAGGMSGGAGEGGEAGSAGDGGSAGSGGAGGKGGSAGQGGSGGKGGSAGLGGSGGSGGSAGAGGSKAGSGGSSAGGSSASGAAGKGGASAGSPAAGAAGKGGAGGKGGAAASGSSGAAAAEAADESDDGGCNVPRGDRAGAVSFGLLALAYLLGRRKRA